MASRPEVSFNAQGKVTMHLEQNGISMVLRFSPEVADEISARFALCAKHARRIAGDLLRAERPHIDVASGVRAEDQEDGLNRGGTE